jgi:hypothetical protein
LEITVAHPTRVYAGVEICQLQFTQVFGKIGKVYKGKYSGQVEATPSEIHQEFDHASVHGSETASAASGDEEDRDGALPGSEGTGHQPG